MIQAYLQPPATAVRTCAHAGVCTKESGTLISFFGACATTRVPLSMHASPIRNSTQHGMQGYTRRDTVSVSCVARAFPVSESSALQRASGDRCSFGKGSCKGLPIRCPVNPSSTPALILVPPISSPTKSMLSSNIVTGHLCGWEV